MLALRSGRQWCVRICGAQILCFHATLKEGGGEGAFIYLFETDYLLIWILSTSEGWEILSRTQKDGLKMRKYPTRAGR